MKTQAFLYSIVFFFLCQNHIFAQTTLDDYLKLATENNLTIKAIEKEYQAFLQKAPQVRALPEPIANAGYFISPVETRVGAQRFKVGASQAFPWIGTLQAKEQKVNIMAEAKLAQIEAVKLKLELQVKQLWYKLQALSDKQAILQKNIRVFESWERIAFSKIESGKGSMANVLRAQMKLKQFATQIRLLENQKKPLYAEINQILNRSMSTEVVVSGNIGTMPLLKSKTDIFTKITEQHPSLEVFKIQQKAEEQEIAITKFEQKPSFMVGLDYVYVSRRLDVDILRNGKDIVMPMVSMRVPFFNTKKYAAKTQESELTIEALKLKSSNVESQFQVQVEGAFASYEDARLRLELYDEQIKLIEATLTILTTAYSNSGRDYEELLRLQQQLLDYEMMKLEAVLQGHLAVAKMESF